jgi:hypothetical protein
LVFLCFLRKKVRERRVAKLKDEIFADVSRSVSQSRREMIEKKGVFRGC